MDRAVASAFFIPLGGPKALAVVEAEGQNQHNSNQPGFGLPAFSSTHSASCVVQRVIRTLIWTALGLNCPLRPLLPCFRIT